MYFNIKSLKCQTQNWLWTLYSETVSKHLMLFSFDIEGYTVVCRKKPKKTRKQMVLWFKIQTIAGQKTIELRNIFLMQSLNQTFKLLTKRDMLSITRQRLETRRYFVRGSLVNISKNTIFFQLGLSFLNTFNAYHHHHHTLYFNDISVSRSFSQHHAHIKHM